MKKDDIYLIDKPLRWTSFDVVKKMRNVLTSFEKQQSPGSGKKNQLAKVGHAGTLDPLATGLLVVCTGNFTKKISEIQAAEKEYTGTITIGATTPSYDLETEIDSTADFSFVTEELIKATAQKFTGTQLQIPPAHSAVKIDGQRAYDKARKGEVVELKPKEVIISDFEITRIDLPHIYIRVVCSKGTYIRSLAHDFGKELGCGAHLSSLVRTRIGEFLLKNALTMDDFILKYRSETTLQALM
ncbi:MAG: tRNA pseudouridine(55) synthase TruB [Bacteroidetes bacterium]|nr:tRNA pseudouridine(55) synthase TruB [Bacteroidota bacterium]